MLDDRLPRHAPDDADGRLAALSGCPVCRLRDGAGRAATARWLDSVRRHRQQTLAALCCPLHAWRIWELTWANSHPAPPTDRSQSGAGDSAERHPNVASLLVHASETLSRQLETAGEHFGDAGWRGLITHLLGDMPPALLWERPPCPICSLNQEASESAEEALFRRFIEGYTALAPGDRAHVAAALCPRDRRLCQPYAGASAFAELAPPPRQYAVGRLPEWWIAPAAGAEDRAFVTRLLESDPRLPDAGCPACFVRAEHERALLADIHRMMTQGTAEKRAMRDTARDSDPARGVREAGAIVEDLCARHTALLRIGIGQATSGALGIPTQWPAGSLRPISHESGCVLCMTLWGWNLARMEGMRRAAGSAALYETITARLMSALAGHSYLFCLPHWQQITAPAPREVTLALLPAQRRGLSHLLYAIQPHASHLQPRHKRRGGKDETESMSSGYNDGEPVGVCPCAAALAALAGMPS
jgi:hypothetical protein